MSGREASALPFWLEHPPRFLRGAGAWRLKEAGDRLAAVTILLLLSPLLLAIALAIRLESPGSVFFRQVRVGRYGSPFNALKFRSMVEGAEGLGRGLWITSEDERITTVGALLRRYSLDELPQLINVARGDMSIIGPRPGLPDQAERYDIRQRQRLRVRPGVTGWAQVNGRNAISWERRIELDREYMAHWSLLLDLYILLKTPGAVVDETGVYGPDGAPKDLGEE